MPTQGYIPVSREIKLPAKPKWDDLLRQAAKDLGPVGTR